MLHQNMHIYLEFPIVDKILKSFYGSQQFST